MYATRMPGKRFKTALPIACIRCVLPNPTPPKMNSGLYDRPGASATAWHAAAASSLWLPTTQFSSVYRGLSVPTTGPGGVSMGSLTGSSESSSSKPTTGMVGITGGAASPLLRTSKLI